MKVQVVPMRSAGVEVPRKMLHDRFAPSYRGELVMLDVTDQGLRRPVKVARLLRTIANIAPLELVDPHILWISENRFVLAGFERQRNSAGEQVDYAQSWLCVLDQAPAAAAAGAQILRVKEPAR